jgi:DNA-binding NarL/FixJ family response regulator
MEIHMTTAAAKTLEADRPARIAIVDDHTVVRYGVSRILDAEKDMDLCGEASNMISALDMIKKEKPDVVIVDISLEGMLDGLKLTKAIKAKYPEMSVLVLSMHDETMYAHKALSAGANGYIMKEKSSDELVNAIHEVLKGEIYVSEAVKKSMLHNFVSLDARRDHSVDLLSDRERQVFLLIGAALTTRAIAEKLFVSVKTIETHRSRIKLKLSITNTPELVLAASAWAAREGLAPPIM